MASAPRSRKLGSRASAKKIQAQASPPRGWATSDEEERERRRQRAQIEPLSVRSLDATFSAFGSFGVRSRGDRDYRVEIRSLAKPLNTCDCIDHRVNGLGTCKHVEAVLGFLRRRLGRRFRTLATEGSPRVEIFADRVANPPRVRRLWPNGQRRSSVLFQLLEPYFGTDGALLTEPAVGLPALARRLAAAPKAQRERVRFSPDLLPWATRLAEHAERRGAWQRFLADVDAGKRSLTLVRLPLYPYQIEGALHLATNERALLGDEMGLGKTVQAIAACELLRQHRGIERVLVISPASLKAEWEEQIAKFTGLPTRILQGPRAERLRLYRDKAFFFLANYEQVLHDGPEMQRLLAPDVIILDEAQRIKNWRSKTAEAVKRLESPYAFVLTGTPLENRIEDVYSIVQFLDPALFGPLFRFNRDFHQLDADGRPVGYKNLNELNRRLRPLLLRRRKGDIEEQLPERTVNTYFVPLSEEQSRRYAEYEERVAKLLTVLKRRPLTTEEHDKLQKWLACMRMLCDTPYILDRDCRICPKLEELEEILREQLANEKVKVIVFSEWEQMMQLVRDLAREMGVEFAWHTGSVPQQKRRQDIRRFKEDPACRLFLSTDAGSVGLNLQAASVVINLDLPWNPAKLEQRIARAWRKHQTRTVQVIHLVSENTIEHRMMQLLAAKTQLAAGVLDGRAEIDEMKLPSGRAAFVERLEQIMGQPKAAAPAARPPRQEESAEKAESASDRDERLRGDLLSVLGDRLLLLEQRGPAGTALAVLDRVDDEAAKRVTLARGPAGETGAAVHALDRVSYEAIQRLIAAGVLSFVGTESRTLHRSPLLDDAAALEKQRYLERAHVSLERGERQARMAAVLCREGFHGEAIPPLARACADALRAHAQALGLEPPADPSALVAWASTRSWGNDEPEIIATAEVLGRLLTAGAEMEEVAEEQAADWLETVERLLRGIGATVARSSLRPCP